MSVGIKLTAGITDAALENTDSGEGKSTQMVTAAEFNFGDVVASHPFGALSAPTQNFAVIDDFDPEAKLIPRNSYQRSGFDILEHKNRGCGCPDAGCWF